MSQLQANNKFKQQNQSNSYRNFSSNSKDQKERYNRPEKYESRFKNKSDPPPKPDFKITENEFPDLVKTLEKTLDKSPTFEMNYKAVALVEKPTTKIIEDLVKPGWVKLSFENEKNYGKIKWDYGDLVNWEQYEEEQFVIEANRVMNQIVRRHENYKINYNNLFGEDAYEKLYGYPTSEYEASETESEYYSSDDE
jgi:hypothetical protein